MSSFRECVLSVDAGGTSLKAALISDGAVLPGTFCFVPVNSDGSAAEIREAFIALGRRARLLESENGAVILSVSVCIPGPFDYEGGYSKMTHKYRSVFGMPMRPWLSEGLGRVLPIRFLHDSTAFLLGAIRDLTHPANHRICGVIIGTGLGFASMIEGSILTRPDGGPEISIFGRPYLGKTAEDFVSKRGIANRYAELCAGRTKQLNRTERTEPSPAPVPAACPEVRDIAVSAYRGDAYALQVFSETGTHLARILLPLLREYRFDLLFLGGAISKSSGLFLPALKKGLETVSTAVRPAAEPDLAPLLGAARY